MTKAGKVQVKDLCEEYNLTRKQYYELRRRFPKLVDDMKQFFKLKIISAGPGFQEATAYNPGDIVELNGKKRRIGA
jgi:hypothetical protein